MLIFHLIVLFVILSFFLILGLAVLYNNHKKTSIKSNENKIEQPQYDTTKLLYSLTSIMASTLHAEELMHNLLLEILIEMNITRGAFILSSESKIYDVAHDGYKENPEFNEDDVRILNNQNHLQNIDEINNNEVKRIMQNMKISISIVLRARGDSLGLFVLGEKKSGEPFNTEDIKVINILAPEMAIALKNSESYEEIKRFNTYLQEEVDLSTKQMKKINIEVYKKNLELASVSKNLADANEKLKALDKLKDEFVSLASHELRTPMTAIKSYLWLFLQSKDISLNEKQKLYIERAYNATDRLITLVNDMLNVSRIESGRMAIDIKPCNLNKLVKEVIEELMPTAVKQKVSLSLQAEENLPEVSADQNKIREVLINLVGNSLKFTNPEGVVTIKLFKDNDMIVTQVKDTGKGIKPDDMTKLFQKFGTVGNQYLQKQNTQGTGLGLYISKSIINLHGGKIWAESEGENKGTTFSFSLKTISQ